MAGLLFGLSLAISVYTARLAKLNQQLSEETNQRLLKVAELEASVRRMETTVSIVEHKFKHIE
jgi:hypothetical protein